MFCPNMFVGLGIDQLCIQVNRASISAHTSFKNMRDMQTFSDLLHVSRAAVAHHAGATDNFEAGYFG